MPENRYHFRLLDVFHYLPLCRLRRFCRSCHQLSEVALVDGYAINKGRLPLINSFTHSTTTRHVIRVRQLFSASLYFSPFLQPWNMNLRGVFQGGGSDPGAQQSYPPDICQYLSFSVAYGWRISSYASRFA